MDITYELYEHPQPPVLESWWHETEESKQVPFEQKSFEKQQQILSYEDSFIPNYAR